MKKLALLPPALLIGILLLSSCARLAELGLKRRLASRPPGAAMPYENPDYLPGAAPDGLPFTFSTPPHGELLGTVVDEEGESGTILLEVDLSADDVLAYYTGLFGQESFSDASGSPRYRVFFPPQGSGASFCSQRGAAVFLEIYDLGNGSLDVRLHYSVDEQVIAASTCGQAILAIEDFPFPYLPAPSDATVVLGGGGGGGGGGGSLKGSQGYSVTVVLESGQSLEALYAHYAGLLDAEGWVLLDEGAGENVLDSSWDFGFYETRSWLARLIASEGEAPNQYVVELRAISP